jgi:hypothetical protein
MTVTNKRLLISESRGDSNRCTPCRGKPDQHATYASHASPRTPGVRLLRAVPVRGNLSWVIDKVEQAHCSREEGLLASLLSQPMKQWGQSQASINGQLLDLLSSYHQYTIGTFNTCSRGPTHRSLTDTDGCYNLEGAGFSRITPRPSQPAVSTFHLRAPSGL